MSEKSFRTALFVALLLFAPAFLFLIQAFLFVPPVFLLAGVVFMLKKTLLAGFGTENLTFLAFTAVHLLVFVGLYWLLAWLLGKLSLLLPHGGSRIVLLFLLLVGLGGVTQLPFYGGAGHGPADMGPLQHLFAGSGGSYGPGGSMLTVCLTAVGVIGAALGWRIWRKKASKPCTQPE